MAIALACRNTALTSLRTMRLTRDSQTFPGQHAKKCAVTFLHRVGRHP